jgi:predicted site-specific integrase-resolvase
LISVEAAAIVAGVNERTIRRWMAEGRLTRYERAGRIRVLVDAAELSELVKPKAVKASRRVRD